MQRASRLYSWRPQPRGPAALAPVEAQARSVRARRRGGRAARDLQRSTHNSIIIHTFDMNSQRAELAAIAWSNAPLLDEGSLLHVNPALASVLEVLTTNAYSHTAAGDSEAHRRRSEFQLEGIMTSLQRAQSQKQMPLITTRLSVACERNQLHQTTWRMLSLLAPGTLASHAWTEGFIEFARERRPPLRV